MIKIFSYGTLWDENIQLSQFGQKFDVDSDLDYISGWDIIRVKIYGEYHKVAIEGDKSLTIMGAIVYIPDDLIDKVDEYEGKEYKRISIKTLTGNECQMYVKR